MSAFTAQEKEQNKAQLLSAEELALIRPNYCT